MTAAQNAPQITSGGLIVATSLGDKVSGGAGSPLAIDRPIGRW